MKLTVCYKPRLEVEMIVKLEEDMLMIRIIRMEIDWRSERMLCQYRCNFYLLSVSRERVNIWHWTSQGDSWNH